MLIRIRDLDFQPLHFDQQFSAGSVDFGPEIALREPLKAAGRAELLREDHGGHTVTDIRIVGELRAKMELRCARCLEPVQQDVESKFDLVYRPLGADKRHEETSISEAETEIGYYKGDGLLLEDVLKEQVLLALPLKTVCREECKGMCPQCGGNLNLKPCNCAAPVADSRWAALDEIKQKLQ